MSKFDRYYISKHLKINEKLANTYVKYNNEVLLISNGYSVIHTKTIPNNFKENISYSYSMIKYFNNFSDNKNEVMIKLDIDKIKNDLDSNKYYRFSKDYSLEYTQLKKITDIIGCVEISVLSKDNFDTCFIKILGKDNQVGYLLPCRVY